jgi:hypothetical protein
MFKKLFDLIASENEPTTPSSQNQIDNAKKAYEAQNSPAYTAVQGSNIAGFETEDLSNPLLQPISGLSFRDYAEMTVKLTAGAIPAEIYKAMNCDETAYAEASKVWIERLQSDASGQMAQLYGKYYAEADQHPKLQNLTSTLSAQGQANLTKLKTDRYYYYELEGAKDAAKALGLHENNWILEKFGIPHAEFQAAFTQWLTFQNQNWDNDELTKLVTYRQQKQKEYTDKISGGQL